MSFAACCVCEEQVCACDSPNNNVLLFLEWNVRYCLLHPFVGVGNDCSLFRDLFDHLCSYPTREPVRHKDVNLGDFSLFLEEIQPRKTCAARLLSADLHFQALAIESNTQTFNQNFVDFDSDGRQWMHEK